jgi:hypothetical protein
VAAPASSRRKLIAAAAVAILLVLASAGATADTFAVTLLSETSTTITLGWTPQPGYGYLFFTRADPSSPWVLVSRSNSQTRSSVTFAKGSDSYKVSAIVEGNTGTYSIPVPPPPPSPEPTSPLFDGRAVRMVSISGSTLRLGQPGWNGSSNASQDPHIWGYKADDIASGVYAMFDDITLVSDPTYGKVYRFEVGQGSTNPYLDLNSSGRASAELTIQRPITMGQWDWYPVVFKIVSPVNLRNWHVLYQFAYPSITSPPLSVAYDSNGLGIDRHYGVANTYGSIDGLSIDKPRFYSVAQVTDKWVEMLVGVKWSMDSSGELRVYARCRACGESDLTLKLSRSGVTYQQLKGQPVKTSANDKMSNYFGQSSPIPTNTVLHRGLMRFADEASARAYLG